MGERSEPQGGGTAQPLQTVGNLWYGSKGYLATGGGGFVNFIDVVRSRKREDQLAEIEEGAISTMLIHLANISYRTGRTLNFDPVSYTCKGDPEATALFTRSQYRAPFTVPDVARDHSSQA